MDAVVILAALAGAVAGFVASAVPGLHVNALALVVLASAPASGAPGVAFLVAALAASPFGMALSSTFLGGTSDESALASLPAHALAREGRGVEAVARQAWGALLGLLVALPLAALARPILGALDPALPFLVGWLVLLALALLALTEPRRPLVHARLVVVPWGVREARVVEGVLVRERRAWRVGTVRVHDPDRLLDAPLGTHVTVRVERRRAMGPLSYPAGVALALAALALSGALGLAALPLGARSPFGWPASPLLPLLAGLFAVPALVNAALARDVAPRAHLGAPRTRLRELARAAAPGAAASALLGLVPGVSASHAALLTPRSREPERALVTLAAVNGGAVVFTLLAWHAIGKARAGALVAAQALAPPAPWLARVPPAALVDEAVVVLVAAAVAFALARTLSRPAAGWAARIGPQRLARAGLATLTGLTFASTGPVGLLMLAAAGSTGLVLGRLGVRRSLGMGVLLVPSLVRLW